MERSSLLRWVLIGAAVFLLIQFGLPLITGKKEGSSTELQPLGPADYGVATDRPAEQRCTISAARFSAELSTRGASLRHVRLDDHRYAPLGGDGTELDLVTTSVEWRMPLRTDLRSPDGDNQLPIHDLDWSLTEQTGKSCTFRYEDKESEVVKVVRATDRPFELEVDLTVTNRADQPRRHRFGVEQTDWRKQSDMAGSLGRISEHMTELVLRSGGKTERFTADDFEPSDFKDEGFTVESWRRGEGEGHWAATSSSYFTKAVVHLEGPAKPFVEALAEEDWTPGRARDTSDPQYGFVFRSRLAYPAQELAPGASSHYRVLAFLGPKEREVLSAIGGGGHDGAELLDLGMFGSIGKVLIQYLYLLFGLVKSWGWAICLLTATVRILLFPLSITQIKSAMAMRQLKPEMDEIGKKYKDDPQQKGLALQELFRKNKVTNPALGCLPVLLQMPVWFALYQALNTAVELYHVPFGPFIPDLSAPGKYFIIPIALGASSFLQMKLMPAQGDPMQQKMMQYMMPAIFTVFMLFLPAGLGIYFMTNTWLGIGQQLAVEKYYRSRGASPVAAPTSNDKQIAAVESKPRPIGKGKSRVQQRG